MAQSSTNAEVQRFIDYDIFEGTSNFDILGSGQSPPGYINRNRSPYIYERPREKPKFAWLSILGYRLRPLTFTACVRLQKELHNELPLSTARSEVHDVYAVTRPTLTPRILTRALTHWSVFCNGHFYHLTAASESLDAFKSYEAKFSGDKTNPNQSALKDEDVSDQSSPHYRALVQKPGSPLLAYHVGQTDCSPAELHQIAEWIIQRLSSYDFYNSNCQHFAMCLLIRILNYRRKTCVFIGTALQIAEYDRQQNDGPSAEAFRNGFDTGFELTRIRDQRTNWLQRTRLRQKIDMDAYQLDNLWAQGQAGLLPNDILDYSRWRRQLCFPLFSNPYPQFRDWLVK